MRGRVATPLVVLVALAAVAGCGKSKQTKAKYIASANAVCAKENGALKALAERGGLSQAVLVSETIGIRERANKQLRAIAVPSGDKKPTEWLRLRESAVAQERVLFYKTKRGSPERRAAGVAYNRAATAAVKIAVPYGLTSCDNFANT